MTSSASAVPMSSPSNNILRLSFNQDNRCFSVATTTGFIICTTEPFQKSINRRFPDGGIGISQMLNNSNILALVGGGPTPNYPLNKVMIWDDRRSMCCGELCFRSVVRSVRLSRKKIVVALMQKIYVYELSDLNLLFEIETAENPRGLCEVSHWGSMMVLVCMGVWHAGQVQVVQYGAPSVRTKFVEAHESSLACVSLSYDGRLMATASSKGTVIRVFNALNGSLLRELRRGHERAEIYSLSFSVNGQWLAASSDKGTVHVFSLKDMPFTTAKPNVSIVKGLLPKCFNPERSVSQFRLAEGLQHIVAFGRQENTVIIIGYDGSFYRCQFDPVTGGVTTQLEKQNFMSRGSLTYLEKG